MNFDIFGLDFAGFNFACVVGQSVSQSVRQTDRQTVRQSIQTVSQSVGQAVINSCRLIFKAISHLSTLRHETKPKYFTNNFGTIYNEAILPSRGGSKCRKLQ